MNRNMLRHSSQRIAAASLLLVGIGASAAALAAGGGGAGSSGGTGGPAQLIDRRVEQGLAPANDEIAYAWSHVTQEPSGAGARNHVDRERAQPAATAISDQPDQSASGVGAHNHFDIGS